MFLKTKKNVWKIKKCPKRKKREQNKKTKKTFLYLHSSCGTTLHWCSQERYVIVFNTSSGRVDWRSVHGTWTTTQLNRPATTQLHDSLRRHLIGCSETRTVGARSVRVPWALAVESMCSQDEQNSCCRNPVQSSSVHTIVSCCTSQTALKFIHFLFI